MAGAGGKNAVARLGQLCLSTAIRGRNHHTSEDDAHHKPSLVEVIDIVIYNTVLSLNVSYKGKPFANDIWIFALRPLVVVPTCPTLPELFLAYNEVVCPKLVSRIKPTGSLSRMRRGAQGAPSQSLTTGQIGQWGTIACGCSVGAMPRD